MKSSKKIKVVKRADAQDLKRRKKVRKTKVVAQDMVSTVTGWVADLKERKSEEAKAAFDLLFSSNSRPSES